MVCNHAQTLVIQIGGASFTRSGFDQGIKNINFVIAVHMLQDGRNAFQAHAGIDTRRRQFHQAAIGLHVKLHEHVVPNFNEAITIFVRAARWAAWDVWAMVIKNFRARTAWAGVCHHPKIIGRVFFTFVVANAHNAVGGQTDFFVPNVVGFVVVDVHRHQQTLGWQFVDLGQQLPTPFNGFAFEIIAKAPIAQHLKKGVMPRGVTHVFQIVVFAACTQARLHAGCTHVGAFVLPQKHVFELHHARVGEHQRRVVARYQ